MDDNDLEFLEIGFVSSNVGCLGSALFVIALVIAYFVVKGNHEECEAMSCPPGLTSHLMNHNCLCVVEAK